MKNTTSFFGLFIMLGSVLTASPHAEARSGRLSWLDCAGREVVANGQDANKREFLTMTLNESSINGKGEIMVKTYRKTANGQVFGEQERPSVHVANISQNKTEWHIVGTPNVMFPGGGSAVFSMKLRKTGMESGRGVATFIMARSLRPEVKTTYEVSCAIAVD